MLQRLHGRFGHYLLLILTWAALSLVNLGGPSLWDIDEGNNAECAREMYESGNWVVPTFNFNLRVDKPALLYWMQMGCYHAFGINEFSARLPSALAALAAVLLTYELGRRMFGAAAGLLSGLVLGSTLLFCGAAHFANPDALLLACTLGTMLLFWRDFPEGKHRWLRLCGLTCGLAMLAKGPVGIVLPGTVIGLFLLWSRQPGRLFRWPLLGGLLLAILVAGPWYGWVSAYTRGMFPSGFFLKHNVGRFLEPMENHRGTVLYYPAILLVGFAPWSVFFALTAWHGWKHCRENRGDPRYRYLLCWIAVYLVFFSVSRTKLPNYVLPLYPPLALLVGHFLDRWRRGEVTLPRWGMPLSLGSLVLAGVLTTAGLLVGGGALAPELTRGRHLAGLEGWAVAGVVPILGVLASWWWLRRGDRTRCLASVALGGIVWLGVLAAGAPAPVEQHKATRALGEALRVHAGGDDVHVGWFGYFQPSLVFYSRHAVEPLPSEPEVVDWLRHPVPRYAVMPAATWERLRAKTPGRCRELERRHDLYRHIDVVLVGNR